MHDVTTLDLSRIAQDLQIRKTQVESVVQLLDEGNTIPFITRYRKERTGALNEEVLRQIQARVSFQRQLGERKQTILKSIEGQGKLTDDLRIAIQGADTSKRLEDLYLPYKPKKRTLATAAREKGLEPLALAIWHRDPAARNLAELLPTLVQPEKELHSPQDIQTGVQHILAEMIAETADVRACARSLLWEAGKICAVKHEKLRDEQGLDFKDYFEFSEPLRQIPPHRILALNRGEKENALRIRLDFPGEVIKHAATKALADHLLRASRPPAAPGTEPLPEPIVGEGEPLSPDCPYRSPHAAFVRTVIDDALTRLVLPSLEREIRRELTDEAEAHAVMVFARNLRSLLLQPPLYNRRVLAIDPGFRTGCKVVALDEHGTFLEEGVLHPHPIREREKKPPKEAPPTLAAPAAAVEAGQAAAVAAAAVPNPQPGSAPVTDPAPAIPVAPNPPGGADPVSPAPVTVAAASSAPIEIAATAQVTTADAGPAPVTVAATAPAPGPVADPAPPSAAPAAPAATAVSPPTVNKREEAKAKLHDLVTRYNLSVIALGNGTACRETEEFVSEVIREKLPDLAYVIVNEAGASVYSASVIGREEFPDHDATVRGTISIGRRLQDPLSELVKVDPQSIGVGLYQHDVNPRHLKDSLEGIIESCVNQVGVDLNTASVPLLRHVSGFNQMVARDVVEFRKQRGPFKNRQQLLQVPNIGPTRYVQAAGFLKIPGGDNALDRAWIHPESYGVAARLLSDLGYGPDVLDDKARAGELRQKLKAIPVEETAARLEVGVPTLRDILDALARPGRDPREDLPPPVFKKGILRIEDLQSGMELKGTVLNVVDFGAFVDIGLKDSGLVHISQMANRYIKSPYDVVAVSDVVTVWVLNVDQQRHRVSLTMIKPGTERKPPEKKPFTPRPQQAGGGERPPRSGPGRPGGRPQEQRAGGRPQGARPGGPPRRGPAPRPGGAPQPAEAGAAAEASAPPPKPPPPPPRKPRREPPRPKLSQAALEGKAPLRTFAELGALFAAKQTPPPAPAPAPAPAPEPAPAVQAVAEPPPVEEPAPAETPVPAEAAAPPQGA
jgi:uncharacterized protein